MDLFITLCILINTTFMAIEHHDMDPKLDRIAKFANEASHM